MDEAQKSRIRLGHWISHNREHVKGYLEVADGLERASRHEAAETIRQAVTLVEAANAKFEKVLAILGPQDAQEGEPTGQDDHHHHGHDHSHVHSHDHDHHHGHDHRHGGHEK